MVEFLDVKSDFGDRVLAPDIFWQVRTRVERYASTWTGGAAAFDWVVLHKGMVGDLNPLVLARVRSEMTPVLANEVFVVFANSTDLSPVAGDDPHLLALDAVIADAVHTSPVPSGSGNRIDGSIVSFDSLSIAELRVAMNDFFEYGGTSTPRPETDAMTARSTGTFAGSSPAATVTIEYSISPVATASAAHLVPADVDYVLTDLSDVALRRCSAEPAPPRLVMDAARCAVASGSTDAVVFCDSFEHVPDPFDVLDEVVRVLRPGGRLFVTVTNADSLHHRLADAMGAPRHGFNHQHIVELGHGELVVELERRGCEIVEGHGLLLAPYWEVPGVGQRVHPVIDDDEEFVEVLRELGERAGPEHAFVSIVVARLACPGPAV